MFDFKHAFTHFKVTAIQKCAQITFEYAQFNVSQILKLSKCVFFSFAFSKLPTCNHHIAVFDTTVVSLSLARTNVSSSHRDTAHNFPNTSTLIERSTNNNNTHTHKTNVWLRDQNIFVLKLQQRDANYICCTDRWCMDTTIWRGRTWRCVKF